MDHVNLLPSLRLILTRNCNGTCYFCHHEGYCQSSTTTMSQEILDDCISAAKELCIQKICLSGGEPTLLDNLSAIICKIKENLPSVKLCLTTNGVNLSKLTDASLTQLDKINLSIVSFAPSVFRRYQNVDPCVPMQLLDRYSKKTTINIVVTDDNKDDLISIASKCLHLGFSVDIMFDLICNDIALQKSTLKLLTSEFGLFDICYASTPIMALCNNQNINLRVKSPSISQILVRNICIGCPYYNDCPEKMCGLRVYPNGTVSPCLNGHIISNKATTKEQIIDLYPKLGIDMDNIYSFFIR